MNQLAQLVIVGQVTHCTANVWLKNQVVGAHIHFVINGQDHSGPAATSTYESFKLPPVKQGDQVSVAQEAPGYLDSVPTAIPLVPPPTDADLSQGQLHLFIRA
jgi:hypothetical protein